MLPKSDNPIDELIFTKNAYKVKHSCVIISNFINMYLRGFCIILLFTCKYYFISASFIVPSSHASNFSSISSSLDNKSIYWETMDASFGLTNLLDSVHKCVHL